MLINVNHAIHAVRTQCYVSLLCSQPLHDPTTDKDLGSCCQLRILWSHVQIHLHILLGWVICRDLMSNLDDIWMYPGPGASRHRDVASHSVPCRKTWRDCIAAWDTTKIKHSWKTIAFTSCPGDNWLLVYTDTEEKKQMAVFSCGVGLPPCAEGTGDKDKAEERQHLPGNSCRVDATWQRTLVAVIVSRYQSAC